MRSKGTTYKNKARTHLWFWRLQKDMKVTELARLINSSPSNVSYWESGRSLTYLSTIARIARVFGFTVGYVAESMYLDYLAIKSGTPLNPSVCAWIDNWLKDAPRRDRERRKAYWKQYYDAGRKKDRKRLKKI